MDNQIVIRPPIGQELVRRRALLESRCGNLSTGVNPVVICMDGYLAGCPHRRGTASTTAKSHQWFTDSKKGRFAGWHIRQFSGKG